MNVHRQTKRYETLRNERNDRIEPHSILPSPFGKKKEEMEDEKLIEDIRAKENAWKEVAKVNKLIPVEVM